MDLTPRAVTVLRAHMTRRKIEKLARGWADLPTPLFCSRVGGYANPSHMRARFARVLEAAGLSSHHTPHHTRHTFASLALQSGCDIEYVSRMLGHASIDLTSRVYGRWLRPERRAAGLEALDASAVVGGEE